MSDYPNQKEVMSTYLRAESLRRANVTVVGMIYSETDLHWDDIHDFVLTLTFHELYEALVLNDMHGEYASSFIKYIHDKRGTTISEGD